MRRCLNVGCGKLQRASTEEEEWVNLDQVPALDKSLKTVNFVAHDMTSSEGLPFKDEEFDLIHAIACLGQSLGQKLPLKTWG